MNENLTIKNRKGETRLFRSRVIFAIVLVGILTTILLGRLTYLQISQYRHYTTLSNQNEIDLRPIEPRRGIIYDRNGVILAKNIPVFSLMITPNKVQNLKNTIKKIKKIISISDNDLEQFYKQVKQRRRFEEVPLKLKLSEKEVATFEVNRYVFPGIAVKAELIRAYPFGSSFAHVLGYVGRINEEELAKVNASNYAATNFIGKVGIEKYFESQLHGQVGYKKIENDVTGATIRVLKIIPPIKGTDLYLTIDSKLQIAAEKALGSKQGAVVAIDPNNGQVLALVSSPAYDPNIFVTGISSKDFSKLQNDINHPMYNRALRGLYPPGSTIKPFIALEGLNASMTKPYYDTGLYKLPNSSHVFHDWAWKRGGHGWINLSDAIVQSCDTYFYNLAHHLGIDRIDDILQNFGFGELTGIDMGEELGGNIPSPAWKLKYRGTSWYPGDTITTGIGQSYMQTTPLQLAVATSILANRGAHYKPSLLLAMQQADNSLSHIQPTIENPVILKNKQYWNTVLNAMQKVISSGVTSFRFGKPKYSVAAKTGTAQVYSKQYSEVEEQTNVPYYLRDNSIFIAFAPFKKPKIAIAVVVEHSVDAPLVARKILDYYLLGEAKN